MICNADESEPGTFKDRQIIHKDPHQLVEGMIISAFANDVHLAYIYIRGEFPEGARILNRALDEAREKGFLGKNVLGTGYDLEIHVHRGAGARIVSLSGMVKKPGYYEIEVGKATIGELIFDDAFGGGLLEGRTLKAVIPGGSSAKVLKAGEKFQMKRPNKDGELESVEVDLLDLPYDFDSLMAAGTMSGSSAIIVMDDSVDIVEALANVSAFYAHESCGQCTPCREGSLWMSKALNRMTSGKGRKEDADYLTHIATNIQGRTICAFGEACSWPVLSFVKKFKDEFEARGAADEAAQPEANQKGTVNSAN
jgi:NADH-quinone oxidoreductase subunit F